MGEKEYRKSFLGVLANLAVLFAVILGVFIFEEIIVLDGKKNFVAFVQIFLAPVFLFAPRLIYKRYFSRKCNLEFLKLLEGSAIFIYFFTLAGTLRFYNVPPFWFVGYDTSAHFLVFSVIAAVLFLSFCFLKDWRDSDFKKKLTIFAFSVILFLAAGIFWELFQKYGDEIFKTTMFDDANQRIDIDVIVDLSANVLGGATGLMFAMKKCEKIKEKFLL